MSSPDPNQEGFRFSHFSGSLFIPCCHSLWKRTPNTVPKEFLQTANRLCFPLKTFCFSPKKLQLGQSELKKLLGWEAKCLLFWALLCLSCGSFPSFPPAKPTVTISPTKMDPTSPNTILLCTVTGFYPVEIEVQWLKNGRPEEEGVAFGEELQNGDWTYQLQVMLETQPQRGDVYTCKVGHASLEAPITVQWEPRSSSSARSKLWTGIMGAVIGVAFLAAGLFSYLKSKKATPIQPPAEQRGS
ncbi:rano class II histocompatibility antigen, A beta chain-like isoform X2 [Pantherophis guttatus]|uniref:Rano class II histocompatibility antigen, A beta chain-like isoform X2 n=1 Tax=Pantherophis guttatus TaxID=94885 RepID=A0ABM3Z5Y5_PANGU|nr:rano class II histocompatibility antigen, A beta chain-like isoform X2 [Pantherophis guttatus]